MCKLICGILALLVCLSLLAGCGVQYECATYLTSTSNSMDVQLTVFPVWAQEIPEAPQVYTVEFQGNTYTGTYSNSQDSRLRSFSSHKYKGEDFHFEVQADTGKLVVFSFFTPGFSEKEVRKQDVPNPKKTAIEMAERAVSGYIDTADYLRTASSSDVISVDVDGKTYEYATYCVTYSKEICGIPTDDVVNVYVTAKGTLKSVVFREIGAFDHIKPNSISLEKVEASIEKRLMEIEKETEGIILSDNYEIREHSLHLTPEKEIAVVTQVIVCWKRPSGDISKQLLQMTTILQ